MPKKLGGTYHVDDIITSGANGIYSLDESKALCAEATRLNRTRQAQGVSFMNPMTSLGVSSHSSSRLPAFANTAKTGSMYTKRDRLCARPVQKIASGVRVGQAKAIVPALGRHLAVLSAVGPLMFAAPAFAQLEAIGPAALADSVTVPLILSTLAGGAVYAALQSKDAKTVLAQVVEAARWGVPCTYCSILAASRRSSRSLAHQGSALEHRHAACTCRTEEPPQHLADSSSPLVKGFEEPMAAVKQAFNDAIAQPPIESLAGSQTPAASPGAASTTGLSGPEPADKAASTELSVPMTQRAALTREEAIAIDQVRLPGTLPCATLCLGCEYVS